MILDRRPRETRAVRHTCIQVYLRPCMHTYRHITRTNAYVCATKFTRSKRSLRDESSWRPWENEQRKKKKKRTRKQLRKKTAQGFSVNMEISVSIANSIQTIHYITRYATISRKCGRAYTDICKCKSKKKKHANGGREDREERSV